MAGFSSLTGGGGLSASSSAKSGDSSSGSVGINIQGITTGGLSNAGNTAAGAIPSYVWIGALVLAAVVAMVVLRR